MTLVDEWVEKAEADYKAAVALSRRRKEPLPDVICFHCQQCVEKYLKAYLVARGIAPPRTHNLVYLLTLCARYDAALDAQRPLVKALHVYAVRVRYPGMFTTVAEAKEAVKAMRRLRTILRRKLELPSAKDESVRRTWTKK